MPKEFTLHQAVFGYRGGHNLLASSFQLSAESRRVLAGLTDASGPWPTSGFEHVLTGIPLPDNPYYALFCTWPAPEMPRPGCVWSHVLLIEIADLASFVDLGELRDCFRRPSLADEQKFSKPVQFNCKNDEAPVVPIARQKDCIKLLTDLYLTPGCDVVIDATAETIFEDIVFAIWSQQWPRLRRNFRFSTGSFSDRARTGMPFDLQITPSVNFRAWRSTEAVSSETVALVTDKTSLPPKWIQAAVADLTLPEPRAFRSFLHTYGADVNNPREAYAKLAAVYQEFASFPSSNWEYKLSLIGRLFPNVTEAIRLKESVTAPKDIPASPEGIERIWSTAEFLLAERDAGAYKNLAFNYDVFVPLLWRNKPKQILSLVAQLARQKENPAALNFVNAVASTIDASQLQFISDERPELVSFFLRHRSAFAFETETWKLPEYIQWRIHETLNELPLENEAWGKIMAAKFLTATAVAVRDTVAKAGTHAIEGAFRWLSDPVAKELLPSQIWREALAVPAADHLASTQLLSPSQLALCVWLANPKAVRQSVSAHRQDVQDLAAQAPEAVPPPLRLHAAFLLVALGLAAEGPEGIKPFQSGFFQVYDALSSNNYFSESWSLLSPELPRSPMWSEWDRCEKLRRAVRKHRLNYVWSHTLPKLAATKRQRDIVKDAFEGDIQESESEFID